MKKALFLFLALVLVIGGLISCAKKAAESPLAQPKPAAVTPVPPASVIPASPVEPAVSAPTAKEMAKFNKWAAFIRSDLTKKVTGKINNVALPGTILGAKIVIMTTKFDKDGQYNVAQYVANSFEKTFPGKSTTIELYDNGKLAVTKIVIGKKAVKKEAPNKKTTKK